MTVRRRAVVDVGHTRFAGESQLAVHVERHSARMRLTGRLDRRTAYLLHEAIAVLQGSAAPGWTIDVTGLDVDHAGLRALGGVYRRALRQGRRVAVCGASPQLQRDLTRLRLASHLLEPSLASSTT